MGALLAAADRRRARRDLRRRGFTLIEIVIALAILGMIATTVYMSLAGALDSIDRVRTAQEPYERGRVGRSFLSSALRSTALFSGLPQDGFVTVDSTHAGIPRDEITFVAAAPPGARTARIQLHLFVADSAGGSFLKLGVRPIALGDSLPPFTNYTLTDAVRGLDMSFLAAPADDSTTWLERWDSRIRLPNAIRIGFLPGKRPDPLWQTPIVVQIPAGRTL